MSIFEPGEINFGGNDYKYDNGLIFKIGDEFIVEDLNIMTPCFFPKAPKRKLFHFLFF